jgi:hypothetical protein
MKQKISTVIEAEILRVAKQRAAEERRPLSELVREALMKYLGENAATPEERKMAYKLFCERPMKIPPQVLRYVIEDDMFNL